MDLTTASECWKRMQATLKTNFTASQYKTFFEPLTVFYCDETQLILCSPSRYNADHVNNRYSESLILQASVQFGIEFSKLLVLTREECENYRRILNTARLNPNYTFNSFVTGQSNLLAYSAAMAVADNPGKNYNPLFLWGGAGLGKTHLMTAIANQMISVKPNTIVEFYSSEQFTNEVVEAIRQKTTNEMRSRLRSTDILFVDDIQLLAGRNATQEEFFNTFNDLYSRGKQIVISADKPPESIPTLEERMRSRFKSGIVMSIDKPDFETRCAILLNKARDANYQVDQDAIERIAEMVDTNIRELEGALKNCDFLARNLGNGRVTLDIVARQFGTAVRTAAPVQQVTVEKLIDSAAVFTGVNRDAVLSGKRNAEIATARHMAIYLVSEVFGYSPAKIGSLFGRDRSTVISSLAVAKNLMETDDAFSATVKGILEENGK